MRALSTGYELYGLLAAGVIATVGAVTDWRSGRIPNELTIPPVLIAPFVYLALLGFQGFALSVAGVIVCGLVPFLLFRYGAFGGGDVKMIGAIGAVAGVSLGIQVVFVSLLVASVYAMARLAWRGQLLRTLANAFFLALNPILPKAWQRTITPQLMSTVRVGGAFLAACLLCAAYRYPTFFFLA